MTLALAAPAEAQTVRVHVVESTTGRNIAGAILSLLTSLDSLVAQTLSSESGAAMLRAPRPGRYRVRADRIGHRGSVLVEVTLHEIAGHQSLTVRMPDNPTVLPELTATATTRCALLERGDPAVATLWDEARKGLTARLLSNDLPLPGFRRITYRRRLSPTLAILAEDADTTEGVRADRPFFATSAAQLDASGFVQGTGPQFTFFGPDEAVILSPEFLGTHCFVAVERANGAARQRGLQFRPVPGRRMPDITGTLWLDPQTSGLATIEFTFVNVPDGVLTDGLGGRIDIARHPSGASFVRHWYIRVPFPRRQSAGDARLGRLPPAALGGFTEDGGVAVAEASAAAQTRTASIRGQVTDSIGLPVPRADVRVLGTDLHVEADTRGVFHLRAVPAGTRLVQVRAVGWVPLTFSMDLEAGQEWVGRIGLEPAPIELPELVATAPGKETRPTSRLADFDRRRRLGFGFYRTREDIERLHPLATADLLKGVAGIRWSSSGPGSSVRFERCPNDVALWVDGARVRIRNINDALATIHPGDIEAMEVYRGVSQLPAEFVDDACAAVVVWTRDR